MDCRLIACFLVIPVALAAQAPAPDRARTEALARRATARIQELQREAEVLAAQERTLLVDLRKLEVQRQLKAEELRQIDGELDDIARQLGETGQQIDRLETTELAQRPELEERLVAMYKLGKGGYARLFLSMSDLRGFGRAYRTVSALVRLDQERIAAHRRTLTELRAARATLDGRRRRMAGLQADARRARAALERSAAARSALIEQIDARRDLNAALVGELQAAQQRLQQTLAAMASGSRVAERAALPLAPFRGALDWPAAGRLASRFGRDPRRFGAAIVRNGVDIAAPEGSPARAVHEGSVAYADPFTGFGNLVIIDHGNRAYSLYGHLGSLAVRTGDPVDRGDVLGQVGSPPTGGPALYFELRIDGKPVDPLQWLKKR